MEFYPDVKRTTGLSVGELVVWLWGVAPEGRLDWCHWLAHGAPL
jgi:hypothetical protein